MLREIVKCFHKCSSAQPLHACARTFGLGPAACPVSGRELWKSWRDIFCCRFFGIAAGLAFSDRKLSPRRFCMPS